MNFTESIWKNRQRRIIPRGAVILLDLLLCVVAFVLTTRYTDVLSSRRVLFAGLDTICVLMLSIVIAGMLRQDILERDSRYLLILTQIEILYLFSDMLFWIINGVPHLWRFNMAVNTVYCLCPVLMAYLYYRYLSIWRRKSPAVRFGMVYIPQLAVISDAAVLAGNLFLGYLFTVDRQTGIYMRSGYADLLILFSAVILLYSVALVIKAGMSIFDKIMLLLYPAIPFVNLILGLLGLPTLLLSVTSCFSLFLFFTSMYLGTSEKASRWEHELLDSKYNALKEHIHSHFIYNTLGTIAGFCETDPQKAEEMVLLFSDYLHDFVMDDEQPQMIPFMEEIEHLKHYLAIEQIRFPRIEIEYDLGTGDFEVPSMILQPLAENAIKHGIHRRRGSCGKIVISSEKEENGWLIRLQDDGIGFRPPSNDGRKHTGISNVRTRLKLLCDGTLEISGTEDKGTVCEIRIPESEERRSDRALRR